MVAGVVGRQLEIGEHGLGPLGEEADRGRAGDLVERAGVGVAREGEWGDRVLPFAADLERLPARDQNREAGAGREEIDDIGRGIDNLLEVVEDQEHVLVVKAAGKASRQGIAAFLDTEGAGDGGYDLGRVQDRRELDRDDAVLEVGAGFGSGGDGGAGLADTAGTGQGDQADVIPAKLRRDLPDLAFASDEGRERQREEGRCGIGRRAFYGALPSGELERATI